MAATGPIISSKIIPNNILENKYSAILYSTEANAMIRIGIKIKHSVMPSSI